MNILYPKVGVCGLSCRLCPMHHTQSESKCNGCKSINRMAVGCPFITCAVKKRANEFCWECPDKITCDKWQKHRNAGKQRDSFKCYQKLEADISFIQKNGVDEFEKQQKVKEELLKELLGEFNDGRSKSFYCVAATVFEVGELQEVLAKGRQHSKGMQPKEKAKVMHKMLNDISFKRGYILKLRK